MVSRSKIFRDYTKRKLEEDLKAEKAKQGQKRVGIGDKPYTKMKKNQERGEAR